MIEPCFGIGHNLSLICQLTSEDIKHHFIIRDLLTFQSIYRLLPLQSPGEIKRREVVLDPQESPEELDHEQGGGAGL